jgi:cardiolipin hydrolase
MLMRLLLLCSIYFSTFGSTTLPAKRSHHKAQPTLTALFAPDDKPAEKLISLIDGAKKSITGAVYMLTDKKIADALIKAKKERKVTVKLVLDPISAGKFGKADYLAENNIAISMYQPDAMRPWFTPIMHHKFVIIDEATLWTGSFNWTVSANLSNDENILISTDATICKAYKAYLEKLISSKCLPHSPPKKAAAPKSSLHEAVSATLATNPTDDMLYEQICSIMQQYHTGGSTINTMQLDG